MDIAYIDISVPWAQMSQPSICWHEIILLIISLQSLLIVVADADGVCISQQCVGDHISTNNSRTQNCSDRPGNVVENTHTLGPRSTSKSCQLTGKFTRFGR